MFDTPRVFAALVILAVLGVVLLGAVSAAERLALPWHYTSQEWQNDSRRQGDCRDSPVSSGRDCSRDRDRWLGGKASFPVAKGLPNGQIGAAI